jgi:antitoxin (DNA-binding transcriptional repressor) of toxin-antitoxin stability system
MKLLAGEVQGDATSGENKKVVAGNELPTSTPAKQRQSSRLTVVSKKHYPQTMQQVSASAFQAACLRLLEQVRLTGEPIEILKNGEPLAVVYPPLQSVRRDAFGAMKESLRGPVGDLVTPVATDDWAALKE